MIFAHSINSKEITPHRKESENTLINYKLNIKKMKSFRANKASILNIF
jgi:hypothetical protein